MTQRRANSGVVRPNTPETGPAPESREEIELETTEDHRAEENIVHPTGLRIWLSMASMLLNMVLIGLDMNIISVSIPSLTEQFKTIQDIGWYSAAYTIIFSSFTFFSAKLYTVFSIKRVFLISTCVFLLGSLVCTVAPTSAIFILGRALAGLGSSGLNIGVMIIIAHMFPPHRRPFWIGIASATQSMSMVAAPLVGGGLIDGISWRACFGINLPVGVLTIALTAAGFQDPGPPADATLSLLWKLKAMDPLGTFFFIPGMVCWLLALQWGGTKYGWGNAVIIVLFILFAILTGIFGYIQYRYKETATLPPRILKQRSILAGAWFLACCNGTIAVTEYYLSIYFQGVKGYTPGQSGVMELPLIVGLSIAGVLASILTVTVGYYYPFMIATSVAAPIAAGLLTGIQLDDNLVKVLGLLGFLGAAIGLGVQGPVIAVQTVLPLKDISTGLAITGLGGGLGSAIFTSVSSTIFQNRLGEEVEKYAAGTNITALKDGGLSKVRDYVGEDKLRSVLLGYDNAIAQTLYLPVALATMTIIGSLAMERRRVKKQEPSQHSD